MQIAKHLPLYLVTHQSNLSDTHFYAQIEEACQKGVTLVQLRVKEGTTKAFYARALAVKAITDRYQIPLIINDRVDICLAVDAAGVHIGDDELPVQVVRTLIGPEKWLGVSCKTVLRAQEAEAAGANYLGVGAIYPTTTKVTSQTPIATLQQITTAVALPVVAIGGITPERVAPLAHSGIAGVAVVRALMASADVGETIAAFQKALEHLGVQKGGHEYGD